jgi:two-component system response regulator NreC
VLLADDHAGMLRGLQQLLGCERDMEVVGEASDLVCLTRLVRAQRPDVLVFDLSLPRDLGIETLGRLRELVPKTEIVVLTMEDSAIVAQRALAAGACGYVTKDLADGELPRAIRAAARGEQYVSPRVATRLEELHRTLTDSALTPREVEVLRLIALGHTSVEIARKLRLSPRTVETHRAHIHKKLGLATRAQLVGYALRCRLLGT